MAKKAGKTRTPGKVKAGRARREVRMPARVSTHDLFQASEELMAIAQNVRDKLDGTKREKANLGRFVKALGRIQSSITEACQTIDGGNPMFHDFKIKCRV